MNPPAVYTHLYKYSVAFNPLTIEAREHSPTHSKCGSLISYLPYTGRGFSLGKGAMKHTSATVGSFPSRVTVCNFWRRTSLTSPTNYIDDCEDYKLNRRHERSEVDMSLPCIFSNFRRSSSHSSRNVRITLNCCQIINEKMTSIKGYDKNILAGKYVALWQRRIGESHPISKSGKVYIIHISFITNIATA